MIYCFDIDGVLIDSSARGEFILTKRMQWESLHYLDVPIPHMCRVAGLLIAAGENVVFATARNERMRETTLGQLREWVDPNITNEMLIMRRESWEGMSAELVKVAHVTLLDVDPQQITFFEDNPEAVALLAKMGCTTVLVNAQVTCHK